MSEALNFDVIIVGAGPAGLSAAIRLKQLAQKNQKQISVCILEKGSEVGAHILSGNVFEPRALNELIPNWRDLGAPLTVPVTQDTFYFLTQRSALRLPTPPQMHNKGNYIISLANLCRWMAQQAEALGVEIYPGFAVAKCLFEGAGAVCGVETVPMGLDKQGQKTPQYEPGVQVFAKHVILAEGARGSVTKDLFACFKLTQECQPQTFGIGLKEIWEVDPDKHHPGLVIHSVGWPLDPKTYGGSFIYHMDNTQIAYGFVIGLDYRNPYLNPYEEFQRFKHHPKIRPLFEGGKRIAYGARALNEGGFQSIPQLSFPGGSLIGCTAGFLNVPKIKGSHTAMKSGMLAADTFFAAFVQHLSPKVGMFDQRVRESWIHKELHSVRNIRPGFKWGLIPGLVNAAFETYITRGYSSWTLTHPGDTALELASDSKPMVYPKPDGVISFDRLTSVFYSGTNHAENQPCHLHLADPKVAIEVNWALYKSPETRYCPAGVYEIHPGEGQTPPTLKIHAQNCVHCKTCDIKDPTQNITWVPPQGGDGPHYPNM